MGVQKVEVEVEVAVGVQKVVQKVAVAKSSTSFLSLTDRLKRPNAEGSSSHLCVLHASEVRYNSGSLAG